MTNRTGRILVYTIAAIGLMCRLTVAQGDPEKTQDQGPMDTKTTTRVTLGSSTGTPGTSVVVPIYFTPASGVALGHLTLHIAFVSANLKYGKLERGIAAEMGNVEFKTDLKPDKNDKGVETSTLTIEASSPESAKSVIPAGLLAYVNMKISENGRPAKIALRASAEGAELGTGTPAKNVRSFDGQVEVFAPGTEPAVSCFFFSH